MNLQLRVKDSYDFNAYLEDSVRTCLRKQDERLTLWKRLEIVSQRDLASKDEKGSAWESLCVYLPYSKNSSDHS